MVSTNNEVMPVRTSERFAILDVLRGFALLGICMANFPEFSLYNFLPPEVTSGMRSALPDYVTRWLLYVWVDGKFYTLFSLLFGIGFSIIIRNAERKGGQRLPHFLSAHDPFAAYRFYPPYADLEWRHPDALRPARPAVAPVQAGV